MIISPLPIRRWLSLPGCFPAVPQLVFSIILSLVLSGLCLAAGPTLDWIRQFGTTSNDIVEGLSFDGLGSIYISGTTGGSLGGPSAGGDDVYISKYNLAGDQQWLYQYGAAGNQHSSAVSADNLGNIFHTAYWSSAGPTLTLLDPNGIQQWSRQGIPNYGYTISADTNGNAYVAGGIYSTGTKDDGLLLKYDSRGSKLWSRQFGTSDSDSNLRVSADTTGNVFALGETVWDAVGYPGSKQRIFLSKFDSYGNEYWAREIESDRYVRRGGIIADGLGNVYISGSSNAPIEFPRVHGGYDAFLAKYDAEGNRVWLQEFGSAEFQDHASGVAMDGLGNVLVTGNMGDPFLASFDANGNEVWIHQFGISAAAQYITTDGFGKVYLAGITRRDLGGPNAGGNDVFIAKYSIGIPEPSAAVLLLPTLMGSLALRRRMV